MDVDTSSHLHVISSFQFEMICSDSSDHILERTPLLLHEQPGCKTSTDCELDRNDDLRLAITRI